MDCEILIPVGPGHEGIYQRAVESVRIASMSKGRFDRINVRVIDDSEGKKGRSAARNQGVENSTADWIFFLDADDLIHPFGFSNVSKWLDDYDAIWGNICEMKDGVVFWRYQVPEITKFQELVSFDPYLTLQMGHFVRKDCIEKFNEEMDVGEDWDYYLKMWKKNRCIKINKPLFLNVRGQHSHGERAGNGRQWGEIVRPMVAKEKEAI